MTVNRSLLAFLGFLAAEIFFGVLVFGGTLGDVPLLAAGLFSTAIGLALQAAPGP